MDLALWQYAAIALLGIVASIINMMAGGGSNLILPLLMMFGVPPDIANGSNRVGVFFQSIAGIRSFYRADRLPTHDLRGILPPMVVGGLLGSLLASVLPNTWLKPALLCCIVCVAALTFFKPGLLLVPEGAKPKIVAATRGARLLMFLTGPSGGFVQASAGFLLLPLMTGLLHYDLVRANALKVLCTLVFSLVSLAVFITQGQVWWSVALTLAAGNTIGSMIGVKMSLKLNPQVIRWVWFVMTIVAAVSALLK